MAALGVCFGVVLAVARLVYGALWAAQGVFTLFAILFAFVGLQFFALGVIGEYIGRIYREVRKRPEYVIERVYGGRCAVRHVRGPGDEKRRFCLSQHGARGPPGAQAGRVSRLPAIFSHEDDPDENCWFGSVKEWAIEQAIPVYCPAEREPAGMDRQDRRLASRR